MVTLDIPRPGLKQFCNCLAIEKGLDPGGHAGDFTDAVILEVPLPWKPDLYQNPNVLSQQVVDLLALWLRRYHDGQGYPHRPLLVAPDPEYSTPGFRRVMFYTRPETAFARYTKVEYSVPDDQFGPLIWALYEARDELPRFEPYRVPECDATRDLLVCTHGTVDAACAKFGFPLYRHMRRAYACADLRVWRVSHFGGHVFAPTLMDMPFGHYWAYVEEEQAGRIVNQDGDLSAMRRHYRGWAGVEAGFLQAAEREMWQREGWAWFGYAKTGRILAIDDGDEPAWAEVRIEFAPPGITDIQACEARVEVPSRIETIVTTGNDYTHKYPQYVVTWLGRMASTLSTSIHTGAKDEPKNTSP